MTQEIIARRLPRPVEADRVIQGYTVKLATDHKETGIRAWVCIRIEGQQTRRVIEALLGDPAVSSLHDTNGRWDLLAEIVVQGPRQAAALEAHLKSRIGTLFDEPFDILLYDLTSTYVEGAAEKNPMMRRGYSRDHRPDCEQMVIALIVMAVNLLQGRRATG